MSVLASERIELSKLVKEKFICLELAGMKKKEIITELVEIAGESKRIANKKSCLKVMLGREELGSTGIGNGVAIPHAKVKEVRDFILVLGRKGGGIDFGALDGERTFLFFALFSPQEKVGMHLKILAEISHLVKDKFSVERLRRAKDKKEIIRIICAFKHS